MMLVSSGTGVRDIDWDRDKDKDMGTKKWILDRSTGQGQWAGTMGRDTGKDTGQGPKAAGLRRR